MKYTAEMSFSGLTFQLPLRATEGIWSISANIGGKVRSRLVMDIDDKRHVAQMRERGGGRGRGQRKRTIERVRERRI